MVSGRFFAICLFDFSVSPSSPYGVAGDLDDIMLDERHLLRGLEEEMMHQIMDECLLLCNQAGVLFLPSVHLLF